ncbi:hypothetical protein JJ691_16290 [Kutzneria sp. CA-103260]|nr:hypothetical protein [Kutzneria sp. CA-103260]QUQ63912.1 hypothetical protein JJ691_16290 [Kutzneria sp. CA-103260]
MVLRDRQDVADPGVDQVRPQPRVVAVDLITGGPPGRHTGRQRRCDHPPGQYWLGRELHLSRDPGRPHPGRVSRPALGQVEGPVDECVAASRGVGQVDRDLAVLDPPRGAGVLPLHPDRVAALLQVARLVKDRHPVGITEVFHDVVPQVIPDSLGVPAGPAQQVLHPVRAGLTGVLGNRPARRAAQPGQQPINIYAVINGHRSVFFGPHNQDPRAVAALRPGPTHQDRAVSY